MSGRGITLLTSPMSCTLPFVAFPVCVCCEWVCTSTEFCLFSPLKYITEIYQNYIDTVKFLLNVLLESCCPPNLLQKHCESFHECFNWQTDRHPEDKNALLLASIAYVPTSARPCWLGQSSKWTMCQNTPMLCLHGGRYRCSLVHMDLLLQKVLPQKLTWVWLVMIYVYMLYPFSKGPFQRKIVFQATFFQWILGYVSFLGSTMRHQNVTYKAFSPSQSLYIGLVITPINMLFHPEISGVTGPYL